MKLNCKKFWIICIAIPLIIVVCAQMLHHSTNSILYFREKTGIKSSDHGFDVNFLTSDKEVYYNNESIEINCSWDKIQDPDNPPNEETYFQMRILTPTHSIVWSSERFYENGMGIQKDFVLSIENDLNVIHSTNLTISLYYYASANPATESYNHNTTIIILKEGNISISEMNLNKQVYYASEEITIHLIYDLSYDLEYEDSYIEFEIFNSTQDLIWNSSRFYENGNNIEKIVNITIQDLNLKINKSTLINITLHYYYQSNIRPLKKEYYFQNSTLEIVENPQFNATKLSINKQIFYYEEILKVNVSWNLSYTPEYETSYVQLIIFNKSQGLVWNSSKFFEEGIWEKQIEIKISELNVNWDNLFNPYYVCLLFYHNSFINSSEKAEIIFNITFVIEKKHEMLPIIAHSILNKAGTDLTRYDFFFIAIPAIPISAFVIVILFTKKKKLVEEIIVEY
ncbi:MAG: hypothetical protein BAJALOKI1v1_520011 [Promethearchaeota archaeon]|nr:MAG: hypothetical protein BAJALOKI1v1_520011 [Candidatus Lokiarchaeota archaeon]